MHTLLKLFTVWKICFVFYSLTAFGFVDVPNSDMQPVPEGYVTGLKPLTYCFS